MAKRVQVPVVGGLRKSFIPGGTTAVGTTIAEFGSNTVTLAQLAAALGTLEAPATGTIGTGAEAAIILGPGLSGGGIVLGNVPIRLTAPIPAYMTDDGQDGDPGPPGIQGLRGVAGAIGIAGPPGYDGDPGEDGIPGMPGVRGATGATGSIGAPGIGVPGDDGVPGEDGVPNAIPANPWFNSVNINGVASAASAASGTLLSVVDTGTISTQQFVISATNDTINGANILLTGTGAAPNKYLRSLAGSFQILNSGYTQVLFTLNDAGNAVFAAPTSGTALSAVGVANGFALQAIGSSTSGQSLGLIIKAGTTSADFALAVQNQASATMVAVNGAGNVTIVAPTSGTALTVNCASAGPAFFQGFNGASGAAATVNGNFTGAGTINLLQVSDINNTNGANVKIVGNGATTPNKYIRVNSGSLQILNSAYSANLLTITDGGAVIAPTSPLNGAITQVMTGTAKFKTAATTSINATLTADTSLQVTCSELGWYDVDAYLPFFEATVGTGGFQFDLNGGTAVVTNTTFAVNGFATAAFSNAAITSIATATSIATVATSSAAPSWIRVKGTIQVTTAGTFTIRWAQASLLAADPTTLMAGASIILTKIG